MEHPEAGDNVDLSEYDAAVRVTAKKIAKTLRTQRRHPSSSIEDIVLQLGWGSTDSFFSTMDLYLAVQMGIALDADDQLVYDTLETIDKNEA